nr:hypothetical protein Iba_chr12aCG5300 [Ipomoea batatas]
MILCFLFKFVSMSSDDDQRGFDAITRGGNQAEKCHSQVISQAIVTLPNRTGVKKHPFMFGRTGVRKHPFKFPAVCNYIRDEIKVKDVNQQNPTVAAMRDMESEQTSGIHTTLS